jgi:Cysteine dioxygenase type I
MPLARLPALPSRDLEREELRRLVDELARQPGRWRATATAEAGERHFTSLYRDDHLDLWLIAWTELGDTGWHDHDISSGAVRVLEGALEESSPRLGGAPVTRVIPDGNSFAFGPDHIHRLTGLAEHSLSLHAYSPPLWRLGQYSVDAEGVMRRVSVSYAEELRPLEAPLAAG